MWKPPKPVDRSALMLRENFPVPTGFALSHVHHASLDMDLGDMMFYMLIRITSLNKNVLLQYKTTGFAGYTISILTSNTIRFRAYTAPGAALYDTPINAITKTGWHEIIIFCDRDGNIYFYVDGALFHSANMSGSNVDQSAAIQYLLKWNDLADPTYRYTGLAAWQHYNFGVGGIPSATDRASIVAQYSANPWSVPTVLSARPNYATEKRLHLNFENLDPAATTIADVSSYANHMTIAGGATVATTIKEVATP